MPTGADFGTDFMGDAGEVMRKRIAQLVKSEVLVGIPSDKTERKDDDNTPDPDGPNNAMIGYVQNYGSPALNIPARPFMKPGIKNAQDVISAQFKASAIAIMENKPEEARNHLEAAGLAAQTSIQEKITTGPFQKLADSTIAARERKAKKKGTEAPDKPLMESGQLRAAISYVVHEKS